MSAKFARCAVCRVTIEVGQPVTFRDDGRLEHVDCPPVSCLVCGTPVSPGTPIRRGPSEQVVHPHCWVKLYRLTHEH